MEAFPLGIPLGRLHWGLLPALVALAALHYVFAAVCLRAAARHRLPLRETLMTQFSAAAANRLTPAGLGAAAVNARFLVCRGLSTGEAIATVAGLHVVGAIADLVLFTVILLVSHWTGGGGGDVLSAVGAHLAGLGGLPLPAQAAIAAVLAAAICWWCRSSRRPRSVTSALAGTADLVRRPRDLLVTLAASAATTLVMGAAFCVSVLAVPGASAAGEVQPLLTAYLLGSAAASALPVPSGLGATEAALVATLGSADVTTGFAVQAVVLFRLITHWAPVPVGLLTTRPLRKRALPHDAGPPGARADQDGGAHGGAHGGPPATKVRAAPTT